MYSTFIAIAITLLTVYIVTMCVVNKEIPKSLSATVFYLPQSGRWLWTIVIFISTFLTIMPYVDAVGDLAKPFAFIACFAMMIVGAAPLVNDKSDIVYHIHMCAAVSCAVASQLVIVFEQPWLLVGWFPWAAAFVWITKDDKWQSAPFWAEITCIILSYALIFVQKLTM